MIPLSYTDSLYALEQWPGEDIQNAPARFGQALAKAVSPRHFFKGYRSKGGEAVILDLHDAQNKRFTVCKFALPKLTDPNYNPAQFQIKKPSKWVNFSQFKKKMIGKGPGKRETEYSQRFYNGCFTQQKCRQDAIDKGVDYGYIPAVYQISPSPKLFVEMEMINGTSLLDWCKDQDENEKIKMFYKIVKFFEYIIHPSFVHSDPKPSNFLVVGDRPVIIDFNISKNYKLKKSSITRVTTLVGNEIFSSPEQLKKSKDRDIRDDIFTLLATLWCMINESEPNFEAISDEDDFKKIFPIDIFSFSLQKIFEVGTLSREYRYQHTTFLRKDLELILQERGLIGGQTDKFLKRLQQSALSKRLEILEDKVAQIQLDLSTLGEFLQGD